MSRDPLAWIAVGWDQSPTHAGIVVLDARGEVLDYYLLAVRKADLALSRIRSYRMPDEILKTKGTEHDADCRNVLRLAYLRAFYVTIRDRILGLAPEGTPVYVAIEDYALVGDRRPHRTGEIGGALRLALFDAGNIRVRLIDPMSLKMFATNRGNAEKQDVGAAVASAAWGRDWTPFGAGEGRPAEDLADAHVLARMVWTEVEVRSGRLGLDALEEGARRVFLRATPSNPVNILDRAWIERGSDGIWNGWGAAR